MPDKYDGPSIFKKGQMNKRKRNFSSGIEEQKKK